MSGVGTHAILGSSFLGRTQRFSHYGVIIMPFTAEQLSYAGTAAINFFLRNDPIDNVNIARPLIKKLMEEKKPYIGGLQYVVEQLRYSNDSNFQSYFGDTQVTYNRKRTLQQAKYTWGSFHDGFGLNEDELTQNGIVMTDDKSSVPTEAEKVQLTNLLQENAETLKLGFQENLTTCCTWTARSQRPTSLASICSCPRLRPLRRSSAASISRFSLGGRIRRSLVFRRAPRAT